MNLFAIPYTLGLSNLFLGVNLTKNANFWLSAPSLLLLLVNTCLDNLGYF